AAARGGMRVPGRAEAAVRSAARAAARTRTVRRRRARAGTGTERRASRRGAARRGEADRVHCVRAWLRAPVAQGWAEIRRAVVIARRVAPVLHRLALRGALPVLDA